MAKFCSLRIFPIVILIFTFVVIFFLLLFYLLKCNFIKGPFFSQQKDRKEFLTYEDQPYLGNKKAPVKIVEFADFKCPTCKDFHDKILPSLKKDYLLTGKAVFYFTNFQFLGNDSVLAGVVGEALYRQKNEFFWKYYDALYKHQGREDVCWLTPKFIVFILKKYLPEVDVEKIIEDMQNKKYEKIVYKENDLALKAHVKEAPTLFINGRIVKNPLDYKEIKLLITKELKGVR